MDPAEVGLSPIGLPKRVDRKYRAWICSQPCCVRGCYNANIDPHHVRNAANAGTALKPVDVGWLVPVCHDHHNEGHLKGWKTFERKYGVNLAATAASMVDLYNAPVAQW